MDYIALSIPLFFLLIGLELLVSRLQQTRLYRFNDAITNLSCGIGQQVIGVFLKTATILFYVYLYDHHRLIADIPNTWLTWFLLFVGVDFCYYWFHRLAHEISVLWGSHVVHHQSEEYNLTVALRQSWFQALFSHVFYLPLAWIGFSPVLYVTIASFQTLYQFWIHTKMIYKLPRWFEFVFNTPSHHRVHHGVNPIYIDRNHGGTLIIFDRLFGTFQEEQEEVVYGITTGAKSWNPLWLNLSYWADLGGQVRQATSWKHRGHLLFNRPGWQPADVPTSTFTFNPSAIEKYDTTIPNGLNYYILVQYLLILAGATVFLFSADNFSLPLNALLCGFIILSIVNCGGLLEQKRWVWYAEVVRLIGLAVVLAWLAGFEIKIVVLLLGGVVLSIGWLNWHRGFLTLSN